ncbi:MAG TPA: hypothetical protein VG370_27535 [Chloroflexota bacterium]|nr:hypothetical protein [Chloroflexota bacterium]
MFRPSSRPFSPAAIAHTNPTSRPIAVVGPTPAQNASPSARLTAGPAATIAAARRPLARSAASRSIQA